MGPSDRPHGHAGSTVISSGKFELKFSEELERVAADLENVPLEFRVRIHNFRGRLPSVVGGVKPVASVASGDFRRAPLVHL